MRPSSSPLPTFFRRPARLRALACAGAAALLASCGGSGGGGAPSATGKLTLTACVIEAGATACQATVAWSTSNASSPRVAVGSTTLSTAPNGSAQATVGGDGVTVTLHDGATRLDERSLAGRCVAASAWNGAQCAPFAVRATERAATPFSEGGNPVTLEVVVYRPFGAGPFPAVIFHHGSTGNGDDPSLFRITFEHQAVARFFAERGWIVVFPQRRGRGASDGTYDEGFTPDRARYSCLQGPALAGVERALGDADAALAHVQAMAGVDASRIVSAGHSRGGVLAIAHAGLRSASFRGAVNFVGGWLGEGCTDAVPVNRATFARGGPFPAETAWIYGLNDPFYGAAHSQANFDAFVTAGGKGAFALHERGAGLNGHFVHDDPALWGASLQAYLARVAGP
ncbi:MAG: alpha/beta hydrolase family protein [Burkholderiales bacterium]